MAFASHVSVIRREHKCATHRPDNVSVTLGCMVKHVINVCLDISIYRQAVKHACVIPINQYHSSVTKTGSVSVKKASQD